MNDFIPITRYVVPDLVCYRNFIESYNGKIRYEKMSFCFKENIAYIESCDAERQPLSNWDERKYYISCRIKGGQIEILMEKTGWIPCPEATKEYVEKEAERELLNG